MKLLYLHCSYITVVEISNQENSKVIKNTLPNKSGNPESLKKLSQQLESSSTNVHIVGEDLPRVFYKLFSFRFCVSSDHLTKMQERFYKKSESILHKKDRNYNSYQSGYKFTFISFCSFIETKTRIKFQQVGDLVARNSFPFCLQRVALYFKGMPNSIDF